MDTEHSLIRFCRDRGIIVSAGHSAANYEENTTTYMWLVNKVREFADRILKQQKDRLMENIGGSTPVHLPSEQTETTAE